MASDTRVVLKLLDGFEIVPELKKLSQERPENVLSLVGCRGKIKEFELVYKARDGKMVKNFFREPHKIINIAGAVEKNDASPEVTLQVSVSKDGFVTAAGKLMSGKAAGELALEFKSVDDIRTVRTW